MCNKAKLTIKFDSKEFNKSTLKEKADYVMSLKQVEQDIKDALTQVKTVFEKDLNDSRNDITETVQITTDYGVAELPSGYAEKTLKDAETEAFSDALKKLSFSAYNEAISTVPKISKVEVNKLRKEIGPIKDLIDNTYRTEEPKSVKYTLGKTI